MKRKNYAKVRELVATAIRRELRRSDGHWPDVKATVRSKLSDYPGGELSQLADAVAAAVLDSELVRVTEVRKKI